LFKLSLLSLLAGYPSVLLAWTTQRRQAKPLEELEQQPMTKSTSLRHVSYLLRYMLNQNRLQRIANNLRLPKANPCREDKKINAEPQESSGDANMNGFHTEFTWKLLVRPCFINLSVFKPMSLKHPQEVPKSSSKICISTTTP
jgi:hypothetical protein